MNPLILNLSLLTLLLINHLFIILSCSIDAMKKRKIKSYPFISFIIPTYNDSKSLVESIESIYKNYEKNNSELFVINDCSTDDTMNILKKLNKKYNFNIINNNKNIGKVLSINKAASIAKGDLFLMLDSDVKLNKKAIEDIIARFDNNKKLGAVCCIYNGKNKEFISKMLNIEYVFFSFILGAGNFFSSWGLYGGCCAVKKEAFIKVGMFTVNAISDDSDLALKLKKQGYNVEQSFIPVSIDNITEVKKWFKREIRYCSGFYQCFLNHYKTYLKNPSFLFLIFLNLLSTILLFFLARNNSLHYKLLSFLIFPIFFMPYIFYIKKDKLNNYKELLLAYPFALIYLPAFAAIQIIALPKGIYKFFTLKKEDIGWQGE